MASIRRRVGWVIVCGLTHFVGVMISGGALTAMRLEAPKLPQSSPGRAAAYALVSSMIVGAAVVLLARNLVGTRTNRFLCVFLFVYLVNAVNTVIECAVFTRIGGTAFLLAMQILPSLFCASCATLMRPNPGVALGIRGRGLNIVLRLTLAWLAFPIIYILFGMLIEPLVIDYYRAPESMLVVPAFSTMLLTQLVRSMLYLLPSVLIIATWGSSRRDLFWSIGVALFLMVGLSGLATPGLLPPRLRLIHGVEILADSLAYAAALVALLAPHGLARDPATAHPAATPPDPAGTAPAAGFHR